jgi:hypothetical protein
LADAAALLGWQRTSAKAADRDHAKEARLYRMLMSLARADVAGAWRRLESELAQTPSMKGDVGECREEMPSWCLISRPIRRFVSGADKVRAKASVHYVHD